MVPEGPSTIMGFTEELTPIWSASFLTAGDSHGRVLRSLDELVFLFEAMSSRWRIFCVSACWLGWAEGWSFLVARWGGTRKLRVKLSALGFPCWVCLVCVGPYPEDFVAVWRRVTLMSGTKVEVSCYYDSQGKTSGQSKYRAGLLEPELAKPPSPDLNAVSTMPRSDIRARRRQQFVESHDMEGGNRGVAGASGQTPSEAISNKLRRNISVKEMIVAQMKTFGPVSWCFMSNGCVFLLVSCCLSCSPQVGLTLACVQM